MGGDGSWPGFQNHTLARDHTQHARVFRDRAVPEYFPKQTNTHSAALKFVILMFNCAAELPDKRANPKGDEGSDTP